jgi:uncharacterized membrane protein YtjA (UPF0391 family)
MKWSVLFLLFAIGSALVGFGEIHEGAASIAKGATFVSMFLFIMALFKEAPSSKSAIRTNFRERY